MDVVSEMFASCCSDDSVSDPKSSQDAAVMKSREEWALFVERLAAAEFVAGPGVRRLSKLWDTKLVPFGGTGEGVEFAQFTRYLVEECCNNGLDKSQVEDERQYDDFEQELGFTSNESSSGESDVEEYDEIRLERRRARRRQRHARHFDNHPEAREHGASRKPSTLPEIADANLDVLYNKIFNLKDLCCEWNPDGVQVRQLLDIALELQDAVGKAESRIIGLEHDQRGLLLSAGNQREQDWQQRESALWFQQRSARTIERACSESRLRGVLTFVDNRGLKRATALRLSDKMGFIPRKSLDTWLGQSAQGEMVQVVSLRGGDPNDVAFVSTCHAAHRELALSPHFCRWMGYNAGKEQIYFEHFADAVSLETLIQRHGVLVEPQPLLFALLNGLVSALADLASMSCFDICAPLSLHNIFLAEGGLRVLIGRIKWGDRLNDVQALDRREGRLLRDFGQIISQALGIRLGSFLNQPSFKNETSQTKQRFNGHDETTQFVFSRVECDLGISIRPGDFFRLDLAGLTPRKIWRCIKIVDASETLAAASLRESGNSKTILQSKVLRVENLDDLKFSARAPGNCRVFLKQVEWWQTNGNEDSLTEMRSHHDTATNGATLVCKVSVLGNEGRSDRQKCSPTLSAIISACSAPVHVPSNPIKLSNLQRKYEILRKEIEREDILDDFDMYTGVQVAVRRS